MLVPPEGDASPNIDSAGNGKIIKVVILYSASEFSSDDEG